MRPLPARQFELVVRNAPLLAVDFLISSPDGRVLLGKRRNPPARGTWCVPGGRVRKCESIAQAVARKLEEELGLTSPQRLGWHGVYEHFYPDSAFGDAFPTHYVALVFSFVLEGATGIRECSQHSALRFFTPQEVRERQDVPSQIKRYLDGDYWPHLHLDD